MLVEVVQTLAGWLTDGTHGVNARLGSVPRYSGDTAPPTVTVVQVFRSDETARGQAPLTGLPALEVTFWQDPATETRAPVRPYPADAEVTLAIRYVAAEQQNTATALRHTAYTLRAVRATLAHYGVGTQPTVNQVQIQHVGDIRVLTMFAPEGDTIVTGALLVTVRARDFYTQA